MIDNSNLIQKIAIRQRGVSLLKSKSFSVLDLYAGEGNITANLWAKIAKTVLCCEKEKGKFQFNAPNVEIIEDDNIKLIEKSNGFEIVDLDAYGLVFNKIKMVSEKPFLKERLIFFTEFNPISYNKNWQEKFINDLLKLNPTAIYFEKAKNSAVIYGYLYYSNYA